MAHWEAELATLVAARGRALTGYAYALCGNHAQAEDLVQDALVKTFSKPRSLRAPKQGPMLHPLTTDESPAALPEVGTEAYVRRVILTLYLDSHRRRARWLDRQHLLAPIESHNAPEQVATASADVTAALGTLSPNERAVVVLRHFEDMTIAEIARAMNVAEGTVKRYLSDATTALRGVLANHRVRLAPPITSPVPIHRTMEAVS